MRIFLFALAYSALFAAATPAFAANAPAVQREEVGNRVGENIPPIPPELIERLNRYQNTRDASFVGWLDDGGMLISTRFAETNQVHRVASPLGMREQLTFYSEPVIGPRASPVAAADGFVFGKDVDGSEFWQLYRYDLRRREVDLLTDGKRSRNGSPLWSHDGKLLAYTSTARNGEDSDLWVYDFAADAARLVLAEGGTWSATDFSPDGKQLLVQKLVSINESYPGVVQIASGELRMFPVDGGKAGFGDFRFARDGKGAYFISDENTQFRTLRYHDFATNKATSISGEIAWDVQRFTLSDDGRHLAFVSNEDGIGRLHLLWLPEHKPVTLPALPVGLVQLGEFSPDGRRLAVTLNTATSPGDIYVIDLAASSLTRWTRSEVGGLDATKFVAPTLIRYPTFDEVDGRPRTIPAFYYRPAQAPAGGRFPVVIRIHGGPEGQALPSFDPEAQFLANELGIAVLVPNVRGSSGYGKSYLQLDNGMLREDSVRDIGAGLDWIAKQPELDARRVGVAGGSYGGYMALATMEHYNDRLKAGVEAFGVSDFVTFLTNTESYRRDLRRAEYGDERDPAMRAHFEKISPLANAHKISIPLFVSQGANDPRVRASESEQIVKKVRAQGGAVWYLLFKDEGHGFRKKTNRDYSSAATVLFWQQHLIGEQR